MTSGVRNETSGQNWPSNTVATDPFTEQNRKFEVWQRYPAQKSGWLKAEDLVPSVSNASLLWDGSTWSLELLTFLPINLDKGPSAAAMVVELPGFASNCPDCRLANPDRWTGKLLGRENFALSTALSSAMSPSKVQL